MNEIPRRPLDSKKFVAFLVSEVTWKVLVGLIVCLAYKDNKLEWNALLSVLAVVIIAGFVEVAYLGGQTMLDRYIQVAKITAGPLSGEKSDAPQDQPAGPEVRK